MARVSDMLQRGGGNQRALFINHVLLVVLWVPRTLPLTAFLVALRLECCLVLCVLSHAP
jgi:hypothetical protein